MRALVVVLGVVLALGAATVRAAPPALVTTVEGISEYRLDNGLRVLLFPEPEKPTVTVNLTYFVGSRYEGYGETGMAHLLEHMMFKGTKKFPKVLSQLEQIGASLDGTTDTDRTNYFETVPAIGENLAFCLAVEADRMVSAKIAPEDLKSEFTVVRNEFEMDESSPASILEERMLESAYLWHNYGKPTIGSRSDIERVPVDRLRAFYQKYYQPDNAMVVIAGKFETAAALKLVSATLGRVPRPKRKLEATYTIEPAQDGERAVTLRRTGDVQVVGLMYHGAPAASADFVAEDAIVDLLTQQPSGRLYQALVEPGLAAAVRGNAQPWKEPGVLDVFADVRADKSVDIVQKKMIEVVEGLAKTPIGAAELDRWRQRTLREIELGLTNPERVGIELSEWAAQGDWRTKFIYRDRVKTLTPADVQRVAALYLKQSNRTAGLFLPTAAPDRSPLPEQPNVDQLVAGYHGQESLSAGEAFAATIDNIEKRTERVVLPSGLKLALLPKKTRGGSVHILIHVRAGNEKDLRGLTEASQMMGELAVRGTRKHSFQQIKDELDRLKAELKPREGLGDGERPGSYSFEIQTVRKSVPAVLALFSEILREPTFAAGELEKLRKEKLARLEEALQQPMMAGFTALMSKSQPWPKDDVRYQPSLAEQIERVKAVRPEQLAELHRNFWGGDGAMVSLVGDFDPAEVKAVVEKQLGDWKALKPFQRIARPYRAAQAEDEIVRTPDKEMAFVGTAVPVEMRDDDPEYPALLFADYVYGGGTRSRIWDRLREKEGLSYGVFSFLVADPFDRSGYFLSAAICAPQNAKKAMSDLLEELTTLSDTAPAAAELKAQKKAYQARFDSDLSNDERVLMLLDEALVTGRPLAFQTTLNQKIQALSGAEVAGAMKKWVKPDALIKLRVGDLKN